MNLTYFKLNPEIVAICMRHGHVVHLTNSCVADAGILSWRTVRSRSAKFHANWIFC